MEKKCPGRRRGVSVQSVCRLGEQGLDALRRGGAGGEIRVLRQQLLRRLAEAEAQQSAEFINIFYGEDVSEKEAQKALKLFTECCPNAEITLLSGGQPVYYYMISAE